MCVCVCEKQTTKTTNNKKRGDVNNELIVLCVCVCVCEKQTTKTPNKKKRVCEQ